jgi:chromosome segregation ATPase
VEDSVYLGNFNLTVGGKYTSNTDMVDLMQRIPQKVRDIEGLKVLYRQKKEQLDAKFKAELAGIEQKIGKLIQERADDLAQRQAEQRVAAAEVKKAQQRLNEAKGLIARTRVKTRKSAEEAQNALKRETDQAIGAIQKEIHVAQKEIQAKEKGLKDY